MEFALIARWLAVLLLLALAGLPVAAVLFERFPDSGAAFALPVALVALTLPVYWLGHLAYRPVTVAVGIAMTAGVGLLAAARRPAIRWRRAGEAAAVFLVAFALLVALRATFPHIIPAGGEKFLDFGLLNALLRADRLPPEDMWFAGERVRYYYGGYLTTALLTDLSGVRPGVAYNLAGATFYALLATAAYGLGGAMTAAHDRSRRWGGLAAAFLVALAGNLATPVRLLLGMLPDGLAARYGHAALDGVRMPYEQALTEATSLAGYNYWHARHVIEGTANVFPYWTFLNGDLRPHMMSAPFLLLAAALGYAYYRTPAERVWRRRGLLLGIGTVAGYLALVNTWSLPTAVGLAFLVTAFAPADSLSVWTARIRNRTASAPSKDDGKGSDETVEQDWSTADVDLRRVAVVEGRRLAGAVSLALVVGLVGALWAAPLLLFHTATNEGIALFPPRSDLGQLLLVHGTFLGLFAVYLLPRLWRLTGSDAIAWRLGGSMTAGLVLVGITAVVGSLAGVMLLGGLLAVAWCCLRLRRDVGYETVLAVAGLGLVLIVELAYAVVWPYDPNAPRWNTVYKVYMQTWVLCGVAAGVAAVRVVGPLREPGRQLLDGPTLDPLWRQRGRVLAAGVVALLLVTAGTFGAVTLHQRLSPETVAELDESSLDGTAYVETAYPEEVTAIAWLDAREGTPTLVTAPGEPLYQWRSAPSSLTGLPTVVGWRHEAGYRGLAAYRERTRAVTAIYEGTWTAAADRLDQYDVQYIYVGPVEREQYGTVSFAGVRGVDPAFRAGDVTVYAVNQTRLGVRTEYRGQERSPGPSAEESVSQAFRERYCSEPADQRPVWTDRLCSSDEQE